MTNFVEFVYQGVEREINTDLIFEIRKPWKGDHPLGSGVGYWTTYQMLNGPVESFFFYNESEAQELYDKLRGKKNSHEEYKIHLSQIRTMYGLNKCKNCGNTHISHGEFSRCSFVPEDEKTEPLSNLDQKVRDIMWTFQGMNYSDKLKYWKEYAHKVADIINTSKVTCTHAKSGICYGCAMKKLGQIREAIKIYDSLDGVEPYELINQFGSCIYKIKVILDGKGMK